jgi:small subunit ribosomal protein S2
LTPRITGHPDEASSILDTVPHAPTATTKGLEDTLETLHTASKTLESNINAHIASRTIAIPNDPNAAKSPRTSAQIKTKAPAHIQPTAVLQKPRDPPPYKNLSQLYKARKATNANNQLGTINRKVFKPETLFKNPPKAADITLPMLLANQTHLGHATSLWHPGNSSYIFGVREGIHRISLDITFAYLRRAAKVVQEVARRGGIILFLGTRKGWDEIVVNSAKIAGGYHIFDRWTPGSLTNGQQILANCAVKIVDSKDKPLEQFDTLLRGDKQVLRPDLVICLNPIENEVCLHECGLYNVPTIGVVDTDCNPSWVTYPIPANDDSLRSIGLISGVLGRAGQEGQKLRLQQAQAGVSDYDTRSVDTYIEMLEEISALDVAENEGGGQAETSA